MNRRQALQRVGAAGASLLLPQRQYAATADFELQVSTVSPYTVRLSMLQIQEGKLATIPSDGSLVEAASGKTILKLRQSAATPGLKSARTVKSGDMRIHVAPEAPSFTIEN